MRAADFEAELAVLDEISGANLRTRWTALLGTPVPQVKRRLLRLALAWELQAKVHGGMPRRLTQRLDQLAEGKSRTEFARPGMRLVREWQGVLHQVDVAEDGAVLWNGETWKSLSEVARAITGTRWSGPAFFGLRKAVRPQGEKAAA